MAVLLPSKANAVTVLFDNHIYIFANAPEKGALSHNAAYKYAASIKADIERRNEGETAPSVSDIVLGFAYDEETFKEDRGLVASILAGYVSECLSKTRGDWKGYNIHKCSLFVCEAD